MLHLMILAKSIMVILVMNEPSFIYVLCFKLSKNFCILIVCPGSSSDPDDLLLGAEANDLRKKHRTRKNPSLRFVPTVIYCTNHKTIRCSYL